MPSYQPKVSTKYVDYPCRVCGVKNTKTRPIKMWIDGIDENNAAITRAAVRRPICDLCVNLLVETANPYENKTGGFNDYLNDED